MKKILLVDDSKALRTLVVRHLRDKGWQTFEADDGQAGVLLALQHRPDLILLDVAMPYLDGPSALLKIRTKESIRNTPVIMMTAASDRDTVMRLARLGIQDYIVKPFTLDVLLAKIERALVQKTAEPDPAAPVEEVAPGPPAREPVSEPAVVDNPERPNLLLVGLSLRNRTLLRNALASSYDLFMAQDSEQAIQLSLTYPPHAVLVDLNNSGEDTVEAYKRLRYLPHLLRTPFIAVRHADPVQQERAERAGVVHFLADPIDPVALNRLFIVLDRERQEGTYGANYINPVQGMLVLRWPDDLRNERLKETTYDIEDNLSRLQQLGHRHLLVQIGAMRGFQDAHLLLMLALQSKARALGVQLAFVTQNPHVVSYFQQYEDTRSMAFHATLTEGWQVLHPTTS